ncbi:phytanoyl-CoA dioxygenase PhyH [Novosphingobium sp. PhB57]|uniref:phytanoyl-CoA dioxygenase family protein n=1 Tax=Novosphingobium sp. PhB57 TaxID=2485107 RepID=UPI0010E38EA7|nr:phytanoyl-CoA dioxygenase family protein [Novosphingobium sp. PhB57]TCU52238.1 phytanoyl-CoA dioxygenase PhyH [Novosphingobium sp. PhB57]
MIEPDLAAPRAADLALDLARDGACLCPGGALPILKDLQDVLAKWPDGRAGSRIAGDPELAEILSPGGPIGAIVARHRSRPGKPVRAVLFDKNDRADWSLGWHQDRTIALRSRAEAPGFGPWTVKQGIDHVEPPFAVIEAMMTLRIHLDPVDEDNASLLVALGSHRLGRIAVDRIGAVVDEAPIHACLAEPGDVWLYRTPILHASHAARPGRRRRVLQVDYAAGDLPAGLEWLGI